MAEKAKGLFDELMDMFEAAADVVDGSIFNGPSKEVVNPNGNAPEGQQSNAGSAAPAQPRTPGGTFLPAPAKPAAPEPEPAKPEPAKP